MDTDRWHQAKAIFGEALTLPSDRRRAFIVARCDDDAVCREALALLHYHEDDSDFLEDPARPDALAVVAEGDADRSQMRIGPYRLIRLLGRGGMGDVYLAERADGAYQQQVAVKLVRFGGARRDVLARLRHERQILASLQHPGIARLLDGGVSDDGLPYLAMEYVEGEPITTYCATHALPIDERLTLFQDVCAAVQYAHQNLVVHRDLKPSNILVTPDGTPKLLDFGVAKLLAPDPAAVPLTRTGVRAMTPEYASPEQVRGAPITTASDVYALGVLLYELLTGRRPYTLTDRSLAQVERIVCEEEPPRPSVAAQQPPPLSSPYRPTAPTAGLPSDGLARWLRGDLDNIVLKALRKEPERRYLSVAALSDDIQRHRDQHPVEARPSTVGYRMGRFVRRHTTGVVAAALVALALVGGTAATAYQARVAAAERDRAQQRFADVRGLANTLLFDLHDAVRDLPGATPTRELLATQALQYLDVLSHEADVPGADTSALPLELAEAYQRVGEIQGDPHFPNLGDLSEATRLYREAAALRRAYWQRDTTDLDARHALATSLGRLAVVLSWGSDNEEAIRLSRRALTLLEPVEAARPDDEAVHFDAARIRSELGWWLVWAGRSDEALRHLAQAEPSLERLAEQRPQQIGRQVERWRVYAYQADAHWFAGDYEAALRVLEADALPHLRATAERHPVNPRIQFSLRTCYGKIGTMLTGLDRQPEALTAYRTALAIAQQQVAQDTTHVLTTSAVANTYSDIGGVLARMGRTDRALAAYDSALAIKGRLFALDPSSGEAANAYGNTLRGQCELHWQLGRCEKGLPYCEEALEVYTSAVEDAPLNAAWQDNLSLTHVITARVLRELAGMGAGAARRDTLHTRALAHYDEALALRRDLEAHAVEFEWAFAADSVRAEREIVAALVSQDTR